MKDRIRNIILFILAATLSVHIVRLITDMIPRIDEVIFVFKISVCLPVEIYLLFVVAIFIKSELS